MTTLIETIFFVKIVFARAIGFYPLFWETVLLILRLNFIFSTYQLFSK